MRLNGYSRRRGMAFAAVGILIIIIGLALGPLPGPGGLPVVLVGSVLLLRNSLPARRGYVRLRRRYPRLLWPLDRLLRRRAAAGPMNSN